MSLRINISPEERNKIDVEHTKAFLDSYLEQAIPALQKYTNRLAKTNFTDEAPRAIRKTDFDSKMHAIHNDVPEAKLDLKTVKDKEKELKAEAKKYGLFEKLSYKLDRGVSRKEAGETQSIAVGIFGAAACVLATTPVFANPDIHIAVSAALVAAATLTPVPLYKGAKALAEKLTDPKNEAQAKSAEDYRTIKRSQFAVRKLRQHLEAEEKAARRVEDKKMVQQIMAAGMPNPGGFISPVSLAQKGKASR